MFQENYPYVTIGIPFFNDVLHIKDAIHSVINQTFSNWELILIDDGSIDNSLDIANSFHDARIKVLSDGENKGLPYRLNQLSQLARGKYYCRMDADDIMFPDRIEKQVYFLDNHSDIDVVGSGAVIIGKDNEIKYRTKTQYKCPKTQHDILNGHIFIHPSVMGKTSWFKAHLYDETKRRNQDFFLWLSSVQQSNFAFIHDPLLFYRVIPKDIWQKFYRDNKLFRSFYLSQIHGYNTFMYLRKYINQLFRLPVFYLYSHIIGNDDIIARRYLKLTTDDENYYYQILRQAIE